MFRFVILFIFICCLQDSYAENINKVVENMNLQDKTTSLYKSANQSKIITSILSYLNNTKTMVADFIQIAPDGTSSDGKFYLSRPGKLRWQYEPPVPMLIIVNGKKLMYYDYELNEVSYTDTDEVMGSFLTAPKIDFHEHNVTLEEINNKYGFIKIMLKHKKENKSMKMTFSENPIELKKIDFFDENNQQTSISFHNIKYNTILDSKLFYLSVEGKKAVKTK